MDDIDVAIVRAMGTRNFGPAGSNRENLRPPEIARIVGLDPSTVYGRIKRMEATGFLLGYDLAPNLALFGLQEATWFFRGLPAPKKAEVFDRLAFIDGAVFAHDFFPAGLCVVMAFSSPSERGRRLALVEGIAGASGELTFEAPLPRPSVRLDVTDWRILQGLRGNALRSVADLGKALGRSARTVRRRLDALARGNAYFTQPVLDLARGEGFLPTGFLVWVSQEGRADHLARVREVTGNRLLFETAAVRASSYLVAAMRNAGEVARMEELLRGTHGVERAEAHIIQGFHPYDRGWLDALVEARVQSAGDAPRK